MRLNRLGVMCAAAAASCAMATPAHAEARVAWMELEGPLAERPGPFDWLTGSGATTLSDMIDLLDEVAQDDRVDGLVFRMSNPAWNAAQIEEIGDAIGRVRDTGKKVYAFSDMYEAGELRLATYADKVLLQTGGAVFLPGLYMEEMFLADTLALVGAKGDFVQIGKYKGAEEQMMNSAPSQAWEENISQLLDSMYETMRREIKHNRGLSDTQLDLAMETAWFADGSTAEKAGLIDAEVDRDHLTDYLRDDLNDDIIKYTTKYDPSRATSSMDMSNPFALLQMLSTQPKNETERDTIAVVHIDGPIVDGESKPASALGGASVGAVTIRETLKEIADDELVRGVIVRINSPGGSAIASENIWQGVRNITETKPVWVSVGSMAASGGYYIAVAGDKIYTSESGIVGSIGVVGGKIALEGVYEKVGVNVVGRSRGPNASMFATGPIWTDTQRELVRKRMTETYNLFTSRVTQGRRGIDLSKTAEGRLFTGEKAIELNMADAIGGLHDAVWDLAVETGIEKDFDVLHYPGPQSFEEFFENMSSMFGIQAESPVLAALREIVGDTAWASVRDSLSALMQLRSEPVLLVSPRALIFR